MSDEYKIQMKRVKRWLNRFEELHCGRVHDRDSDYYQDVVYAFFQNCFHLKDWIKNSGHLNETELFAFINLHEELQICRDLCNSSKHLLLNDSFSIDRDIKLGNREFSLSLGGEDQRIQIIYYIEVAGAVQPAFMVAVRCVMLWEEFLKEKGLVA